MFYREAGDFKTSYKSDQETFPLKLDKILFWLTMAIAVFIVPLFSYRVLGESNILTFLYLCSCSNWFKYPYRLLWPGFTGNWWLYGGRSLR